MSSLVVPSSASSAISGRVQPPRPAAGGTKLEAGAGAEPPINAQASAGAVDERFDPVTYLEQVLRKGVLPASSSVDSSDVSGISFDVEASLCAKLAELTEHIRCAPGDDDVPLDTQFAEALADVMTEVLIETVIEEYLPSLDSEHRVALLSGLGAAVHGSESEHRWLQFLKRQLGSADVSARVGATYGIEAIGNPELADALDEASRTEPVGYLAHLQHRVASSLRIVSTA